MKNYKNAIILGELDYVLTASFDTPASKAKCLAYESDLLPMDQNENGATNINTLYVLNETLEALKEEKEKVGRIPDTHFIAIPGKLYLAIHKGTYKTWLKNDGIAANGTKLDDREMNEWARFATLYSKLFSDVSLRDLTYYEMTNPRYNIELMKKHQVLIKAMRENMAEHKEQNAQKAMSLDF